ncbi:uncharacterized protein LOC124288561 [Haliotis rubra]|uniref:uncharacterized protein LOC124288561 n=1 Tax=Haliotis rubra TaxID=36100 RepID=UPI001EE6214E|nr:uncharacterized protein LOC124288561 [Haliotis rubra]
MSSNLWDDAEDNQSQFSRSDRYSRSRFQHDSRGTGYFDRTSQQTSGKMWGDADQNPSQFSPGSRTMSDRMHGYGRGSNYDFQQESWTDTTSHTRGGLRPSFRDESFEKEQRIDYFGTQSRGPTGMESEITWTRGNSRSGLEMDRLTNTSMDTVSRFGMELTGQTSTPNVEKDLSRFLSKRSNTSNPMEIGSKRLDTFEGGRKPTNPSEPEFNSNRTRGPYYQPRNETRTEWSHESHRGQSAEPFRESEHFKSEMSRRTPALQGMQQGRDSSVLDTGVMQELRMRMAAERQHHGENAVDMNKVMKVMKIVDQFSEEHRQDLSQSISAITRGSYGKEAPGPPQESRGLKRGGSMHGFRDDSSFKRGRMEGFTDRPRPSSYQQTETLRRPQSSIQPRPSSYRQTETLRRPHSGTQPRPSSYQQTETPRRPQSGIQPRPSSYHRTETPRRPQSSFQPKEKPVPLLSLDLGIPDQGSPSAPQIFESKLTRLIADIRNYRETEDHVNDIHTLDIFMSKCKLKSDYKQDSLGRIGKKLVFTGSLQINNVFLARSAGISKKEVKHACYEKAIAVLMTNPVSEILKFEDEGVEKLRMKLLADEEEKKAKEVVVAAAAAPPPLTFREKLEKLIDSLNSFEKRAETPIIQLNNANVSTSLIFHREYKEETIHLWGTFCLVKGLLMLDGHLIATAVGRACKRVKYKTYAKGVEFLRNSPMSVVLEGVPADDDYTNLSAHDVLSHRHVSLPDHQTEQKMGRMISEVKNIVASKQPPSNTLQITCKNNHLLLTCLFKKRTRGALSSLLNVIFTLTASTSAVVKATNMLMQ